MCITVYSGRMANGVKREGTERRPSALSGWYRAKLGRDVAISDIDWVITSISNKNTNNRYLVIEEKTVSNSDQLLLGLGQARSLKELKQDILKNNIPFLVVFIKDEDLTQGIWTYEFDPEHINNKKNWHKIGDSWYVDVKKYAKFYKEDDLRDDILSKVRSLLIE